MKSPWVGIEGDIGVKGEKMWGLLSHDIKEQLRLNQRWTKSQWISKRKMVMRVELEIQIWVVIGYCAKNYWQHEAWPSLCTDITSSLLFPSAPEKKEMKRPSLLWWSIGPCGWQHWEDCLRQLAARKCILSDHSTELDFEYQSFSHQKVWVPSFLLHGMERTPTTVFYFFIRTLK